MSRIRFSHSENDEYNTPLYAVAIIASYLLKLKDIKTIWCPFDEENSNYVKLLRNLGYKVVATIYKNEKGQDFLTYMPDFEFDAIVSNPPFSIKNEILEKCYSYNKPFALLLPFTMFNSKGTIEIINKHSNNIQFLMINQRISFNGARPNFGVWYICKDILPSKIETFCFKDDPKRLYQYENNESA